MAHQNGWWITLLEIFLELVIIAMIAWEIHEGNKQYHLLETMNANAAATVAAMGKLQQAQDNSLKTSNDSLRANQQIAGTLTNQLKILKIEQDARLEQQNRRPILELTTVTWEPGVGSKPVRVESGKMPAAGVVRVGRTMGTDEVTLYFALRNVGTSPAINATVKPRTSSKVQTKCVESGVQLAATPNFSYTPCEQPSGTIPPIYPRPGNRTVPDTGWVIPGFDDQYDAMVAVVVVVPLDIRSFDVELVVNAEQVIPLVYRLQCLTNPS